MDAERMAEMTDEAEMRQQEEHAARMAGYKAAINVLLALELAAICPYCGGREAHIQTCALDDALSKAGYPTPEQRKGVRREVRADAPRLAEEPKKKPSFSSAPPPPISPGPVMESYRHVAADAKMPPNPASAASLREALIGKARTLAVAKHPRRHLRYGRPLIEHLDAVYRILVGIAPARADNVALCTAVYLYDLGVSRQLSLAEIEIAFGVDVRRLVRAVMCPRETSSHAERNKIVWAQLASEPLAIALELAIRIAALEAPHQSFGARRLREDATAFYIACRAASPGWMTGLWARAAPHHEPLP